MPKFHYSTIFTAAERKIKAKAKNILILIFLKKFIIYIDN